MKTGHFSVILTIFVYAGPLLVGARGPHHPQGSAIVKRHTHYNPIKNMDKITQDTDLLLDREHIREHLEEVVPKVDLSEMTDAEIQLYYFLLHDTDKNSKLDGLEILNSILHTRHQEDDNQDDGEADEEEGSSDNDLNATGNISEEEFSHFVELVDHVLKEDDTNQDGYLDYQEYVEGARNTRAVDQKRALKLT